MANISEFKNYIVFDSTYKSSNVNNLDKSLEDYDSRDDINLCKHCFYGGGSSIKSVLDNINTSKSQNKSNNKSNRHQKQKNKNMKKNKTSKK